MSIVESVLDPKIEVKCIELITLLCFPTKHGDNIVNFQPSPCVTRVLRYRLYYGHIIDVLCFLVFLKATPEYSRPHAPSN